MFFHDMKLLERVLWLKLKNGSGNPMHEATSTSGSFVTDVVAPLKKLLVNLSPIQSGSGTPSPDNVRPISGHTEVDTEVCGKNLWSDVYIDYTKPRDYHILPINLSIGQTYTVTVSRIGSVNTGCAIGIVKDGDRYSNFVTPPPWLFVSTSGDVAVNKATYTIDATWTNPKLVVYAPSESAFNLFFENYEVQFESGSTDTSYHAYQGNTYTTTLGRTVYGGTLDVVSGELIVDKGFAVFDGSETWTKNTRALNGFYTARPQGCKQSTTMVSNSFTYVNNVQDLYNTYGACFCGSSMNFNVDPETIGGDTIEDWKAWLAENPLQVVYELTSPQTYQLTRQQINSLIGQNNIITENGVEVSEIVYLTMLVGSSLLGSPQTEEPTEETDEPIEETEEPEGE